MKTGIPQTFLLLTVVISIGPGCSGIGTSRWAMDNGAYSKKYDVPYTGDDVDKVERMVKQSVDARHVDGQSGVYTGFAASDDPFTLGAEVGCFEYLNHSVEGRVGLKGLLGTGDKDYFVGIDAGLRLQSPTRFAPFVGVGTYVGGNGKSEAAEHDNFDNDDDGSTDEIGERKDGAHMFASIYPEVGAHFWLNGQTRLTASAQYHLTTAGRDDDFAFFGISVARLIGN